MKKSLLLFLSGVLCCIASMAAALDANSKAITGYWETIDNITNKPAGIIKIWESGEKFYGKIVKSYEEDLSSAKKTKSSVGSVILRDLIFKNGSYMGGYIVDPRNGKKYRLNATVIENGAALKLRGYIGMPVLGRTMIWKRATAPSIE